MAVPFSDLQAIAPSAVIELFQLELNVAQHGVNETYYFHAGVSTDNNTDITWNGVDYLAFPIEATDFEYTGTGSLPRPKLVISNIFGTITGLILSLPNGLEGAKVTRIRTLARYIDGVNFPGGTNPFGTPDPTAEFPREIYYIDRKAGENRDAIEFELAAAFDLVGVRAPKRQCISNMCQWIYRGSECGYTGNAYFDFNDNPVNLISQDVCGKRLNSCELRFAQQRFVGAVTTGSNVITLDRAVSLSTGDPVTGFGLPASTTVSSTSGNLVTVSQNATATSDVTTTGTLQNNLNQIVVTSATGLAVGMDVTGNYLQPNTQITAISGTTITLSTTADVVQFLTSATSFTSIDYPWFSSTAPRNEVWTSSAYAFTVNAYISGPGLSVSSLSKIKEIKTYATKRGLVLTTTLTAAPQAGETWTIYNQTTPSSATYIFTATDKNYTFRANASIPYGSYPGVGAYFT